jgi:inosine/xanthosine triphosphate pyrophosphatase family protein/dephospho-CoA kinase
MSMLSNRPSFREILHSFPKRVEVVFYTSNLNKFLQARLVFERNGIVLRHFKSRTEPYSEDYNVDKSVLLANAIQQILSTIGRSSIFFVEDTSLRIEALSSSSSDFPGLAVKEWFNKTTFNSLDTQLKETKRGRKAIIKSDIGLHIPGLSQPVFFHGSIEGDVSETPPNYLESIQYPWLTPKSFNGWFIPNGCNKTLGEMSIDESWNYDFRVFSLTKLIDRLEEYSAILNLPRRSYTNFTKPLPNYNQLTLFSSNPIIVIGQSCSGKTTFGEHIAQNYSYQLIDASSIIRSFKNLDNFDSSFELASSLICKMGPDIVARKIIQLFGGQLINANDQPLIVTGFRTIEEIETIRSKCPNITIILVESSDKTRYERHIRRARDSSISTFQDFLVNDEKQRQFGLLRVAQDFADIRIINEGSIHEFWNQISYIFLNKNLRQVSGIYKGNTVKNNQEQNQLIRCLEILAKAARPLICNEIEDISHLDGIPIRSNNANKILKLYPEFTQRFDSLDTNIRYEISNSGIAYIRYLHSVYSIK